MKRPLAVMMNKNMRTIQTEGTLLEAARLMRELQVGALLVEENGHLVGVVSETDLVRKAMAEGREISHEKVRTIMSSPIITIDIERPASDASDLMSEKGIRHLAVTDSGKIVGVISVRDLLRYYKNWGAF
ncbi:MAG TPA: CBS domain-containing protein [Nitrospiria bacterium]|nr:CBS domain-containing protein [Nitrospiria bacterium]